MGLPRGRCASSSTVACTLAAVAKGYQAPSPGQLIGLGNLGQLLGVSIDSPSTLEMPQDLIAAVPHQASDRQLLMQLVCISPLWPVGAQ